MFVMRLLVKLWITFSSSSSLDNQLGLAHNVTWLMQSHLENGAPLTSDSNPKFRAHLIFVVAITHPSWVRWKRPWTLLKVDLLTSHAWDKLIAALDPNGFRPFLLQMATSLLWFHLETCAFEVVGAEWIRAMWTRWVLLSSMIMALLTMTIQRTPNWLFAQWSIFTCLVLIQIIQGVNVHTARKRMGLN